MEAPIKGNGADFGNARGWVCCVLIGDPKSLILSSIAMALNTTRLPTQSAG